MQIYLRKYGVQTTLHFTLFEVDGVDFRIDAVDAGSDCSIMKDEGAEATCVNDFADEGKGYSLVITATEMEFAEGMIYIVDSATKVWLDEVLKIETYGNASAMHAMDFDTTVPAMVGTDNAALASVVGALNNAAADGDPSDAETLMQYIKQLINILIGTAGIVAFPAEGAPANAVSLAEVIRAIHVDVTGLNGSAMVGTNGANTTTPPTVGEIQTEMEENGASLLDTIRDELANGTDGLSALKTLIDAIPVLTTVVEGTTTWVEAVRLFLSALTGKSFGGGTATVGFRDIGDTKNRISATVDADGNRTAVGTRDGS